MSNYIRLIRPQHWLKNTLILAALIFSQNFFNVTLLKPSLLGVAAFCLISSAVYVLNDIRDVKSDRMHKIKCKRPIASGAVSIPSAYCLLLILFLGAFILNYLAVGSAFKPFIFILLYFVFNVMYSAGLKKVPILDIVILVSGFCSEYYMVQQLSIKKYHLGYTSLLFLCHFI